MQRQRDILASCIETLELKYRRVIARESKKVNCAFYYIKDG